MMQTTYTGRLVRLRPFASVDEGLELVRDIHLRLIPGWGEQWTPLSTIRQAWAEDGWMGEESVFAVERLDTGALIGYEIATPPTLPELTGWLSTYIREGQRGQGFGVEAKRLALRFLFEHYPLDNVAAITLSSHARALRGLELAGLREEGRIRGCTISEGRWDDKVYFALSREEWEAQSAEVPDA